MSDEDIQDACTTFSVEYHKDVSPAELTEEMLQVKCVHAANFTSDDSSLVTPVNLLNKISSFKLEEIFANVCTSLRIFCALPVTVA